MNSITVFYVSIGSGHQVAAEAVAEVIRKQNLDQPIVVIDPFSARFTYLPKLLSYLQAMTVRHARSAYDYAWRGGLGGKLFRSIIRIRLFQQLMEKYLEPNAIVVCTHGLPMCIAAEMKSCGKIARLYGIITDYGAHHYWPIANVDGYFTAHEGIRDELIRRGVDQELINVTGIPVRSSFQLKPSLRKPVGPLRLLILAGGVRHGAYVKTHDLLLAALESLKPVEPSCLEIAVVTGNESKMLELLLVMVVEMNFSLTPYGFVEHIEQLISWSDVVISKPGGLIISEALAIGRGMIILPAGPGQEAANRQFLLDHNIGLPGDSIDALTASIRQCLEDPDYIHAMQKRALALGKPDAANCIVSKIMSDQALSL